MRLTIVPEDGAVYKDGLSFSNLDLSFIPSNIHALQWYDLFGEVEFKTSFVDGVVIKPSNSVITELPTWAVQALTVWQEAYDASLVVEDPETEK